MKAAYGRARLATIAILGVAAFAIATAAVTLSQAQLASSPWPMFHHDLAHTGVSEYNTNGNNGALEWKFSTGGAVYSSPAIAADGTIYIGSNDGNVYAINPDGTRMCKLGTGGYLISRRRESVWRANNCNAWCFWEESSWHGQNRVFWRSSF